VLPARKTETAAVVGGGIGGLSAAAALAAKGFHVSLFEKNAALGGKAGSREINGYRFDTGPSLLTLPHMFDRLFHMAERRREDYIDFIPLSPITRYWFDDGSRTVSGSTSACIDAFSRTLNTSRDDLERYFRYCRKIYAITHRLFLEKSLHRIRTYTSKETLHSLFRFFSIDPFRTMHKANSSFFSDARMVQLFDRFATYNGSSPYKAPAALNNIVHVEHGIGGFAVSSGIYGIIQGLERLADELGADIHREAEVRRILYTRNKRNRRIIEGIQTDKNTYQFRVVVSDVDVMTLYTRLLNDQEAPMVKRYRKLPPSSSGIVFYWGMLTDFPELGIHNIFFSADYKKEFMQIHDQQSVPDDPTVYVNITSKITPSDAPAGCENWFVLINAPPHDGRDWKKDIPAVRAAVLKRISRALGKPIEQYISEEAWLTPDDIEKETGSFRGSLYGISSNSASAAFFRHPNSSRRYRGLYLCGGSVHPGGGMPLAASSGMIAADIIARQWRRQQSV